MLAIVLSLHLCLFCFGLRSIGVGFVFPTFVDHVFDTANFAIVWSLADVESPLAPRPLVEVTSSLCRGRHCLVRRTLRCVPGLDSWLAVRRRAFAALRCTASGLEGRSRFARDIGRSQRRRWSRLFLPVLGDATSVQTWRR